MLKVISITTSITQMSVMMMTSTQLSIKTSLILMILTKSTVLRQSSLFVRMSLLIGIRLIKMWYAGIVMIIRFGTEPRIDVFMNVLIQDL